MNETLLRRLCEVDPGFKLGRDSVELSDRLGELGADSLSKVNLVICLEDEFDLRLPADFNYPDTVLELAEAIATAIAEKESAPKQEGDEQ